MGGEIIQPLIIGYAIFCGLLGLSIRKAVREGRARKGVAWILAAPIPLFLFVMSVMFQLLGSRWSSTPVSDIVVTFGMLAILWAIGAAASAITLFVGNARS